ncbi:MAG: NUDIX hydrolase [bacterium]|nr:NUDIX hydrolase [bacterium]
MTNWIKQSEKQEKVGWRYIVHKVFKLPNGKLYDFTTYDLPGTHYCGIIALTKDLKVIIVSQYRPGPEKLMDEIMGGGMESEDKNFQDAAVREMKEESGYAPGNVIDLGIIYKDAYNNAIWHYYLATDCVKTAEGQMLEDTEFAEVKLISIEKLLDNARTAKMTDVEAVFLAYDELMKIKEGVDDKS